MSGVVNGRALVTAVAAALFASTVIAANYATSRYGLVPVGFGLTATAGTYFAGAAFVLRDATQDLAGQRWALAAIASASVMSFALADPAIAAASAAAFAVSEVADLVVYTPLRRRGYLRAAIASNVVGAAVDTFVFLALAGFPIVAATVGGQVLGKLTITAAVVLLVGGARALLRQPVNREGA